MESAPDDREFAKPALLTEEIASIEAALAPRSREHIAAHPETVGLEQTTLPAALAIKEVAGQINVIELVYWFGVNVTATVEGYRG